MNTADSNRVPPQAGATSCSKNNDVPAKKAAHAQPKKSESSVPKASDRIAAQRPIAENLPSPPNSPTQAATETATKPHLTPEQRWWISCVVTTVTVTAGLLTIPNAIFQAVVNFKNAENGTVAWTLFVVAFLILDLFAIVICSVVVLSRLRRSNPTDVPASMLDSISIKVAPAFLILHTFAVIAWLVLHYGAQDVLDVISKLCIIALSIVGAMLLCVWAIRNGSGRNNDVAPKPSANGQHSSKPNDQA